jgi:hypothetical protein
MVCFALRLTGACRRGAIGFNAREELGAGDYSDGDQDV